MKTGLPVRVVVPATRRGTWMGSNLSRTVIVARPLPEPQPAASKAETASISVTALAIAVGSRAALREQIDENRRGEADHVQVVAFDPLHERGAETLDRVAAGAPAPLLACDVEAELPGRQRPE